MGVQSKREKETAAVRDGVPNVFASFPHLTCEEFRREVWGLPLVIMRCGEHSRAH